MRKLNSVLILGVAGCAGALQNFGEHTAFFLHPHPTPYQAWRWDGGYKDFEVPGQPGVHFVSFYGNGITGRTEVARYWYQRVQELCGDGAAILSSTLDERTETTQNTTMTSPVSCIPGATGPMCQGGETMGGGSTTSRTPFMEGYVRCVGQPVASEHDHH